MKIYDTHSDVFSNLFDRYTKGERDIFEKYHIEDLKKGDVVGGIWVVYSDKIFDIIEAYEIALKEFDKYKNNYDVVYGLEGLRNVPDLETLDKLYKMGIRHAGLTWNEENHLATGIKGSADRGVTPLGKEFLRYMNEHKMITDVSHLNIKSFYDVIDFNPDILIASHSNAFNLANHPRNLNDDQLKKLYEAGGYVGVVAARNFVSHLPEKQNVEGYVDQMIYLIEHLDIDHVMIGIDMMSYLTDFNNANLNDLQTHADTQNIVTEMKKRLFTEEDIRKITSENFLRIKKMLK